MSVKCPSCGTVQPSGKFCPSCGTQMVSAAPPAPPQQSPAAAQMPPQPYPPHPYPQPEPKAGGGKGWVLWAAIGGGVLVLGAVLAFVFLREKPTTPPPQNSVVVTPQPDKPANPAPAPSNPTPAPAPAGKSVGGTPLKLLSQGSFGARPNTLVVSGSYVGYGTDQAAAFYKVDAKGQVKKLARLDLKTPVGKMLSVAVGEMYNDGKTYMLALYEKKLYIVAEQGGVLKEIDVNGVDNVFIGDYDGDGKTETVYMGLDTKGTYGFDVWRYPAESYLYRKEGRQDPWPELFQTEMKAGTTSLLMGYTFEGDALYLLLYKWDGIGGPVVIGKYLMENKTEAPVEWIASGPSGFGPTLAVARSGAKPAIEVLQVASDAKSAKSLGRFESDGTGRSAVIMGKLTGQGSQLLTVDEAGSYFLYDIGK